MRLNSSSVYNGDSYKGTLVDRSGTATVTSQILAPANPARKYLFIQNISGGVIWVNFGAVASPNKPSIRLQVGEAFIMDGFICTDYVSVIAGATTKDYTAKEGQ